MYELPGGVRNIHEILARKSIEFENLHYRFIQLCAYHFPVLFHPNIYILRECSNSGTFFPFLIFDNIYIASKSPFLGEDTDKDINLSDIFGEEDLLQIWYYELVYLILSNVVGKDILRRKGTNLSKNGLYC